MQDIKPFQRRFPTCRGVNLGHMTVKCHRQRTTKNTTVGRMGRKKQGYFIRERQEKRPRDGDQIDVGYVPVRLHENLRYDRKGQRSLSDSTEKVFGFIRLYFKIPSDIERSKKVFHPKDE